MFDAVVTPLFQLYVNGATPPLTDADTLPVLAPWHCTPTVSIVKVKVAGELILPADEVVQPV